MKKLKLNQIGSSSLKDDKLQELKQLTIEEKQKILGGDHRVSQNCTLCDDDLCDGQYDNNKDEQLPSQ